MTNEEKKEYQKEWYKKNKEKTKQANIKWKQDHPNYQKEWKKLHRKERNERSNNRYFEDILYNTKISLKSKTRRYIKSILENKGIRLDNFITFFGCDPITLKTYIESKFIYDMTWGSVVIDHIIPFSSATTKEEMINLTHYTNLQPLPKELNLSKGDRNWSSEYTKERLNEHYKSKN